MTSRIEVLKPVTDEALPLLSTILHSVQRERSKERKARWLRYIFCEAALLMDCYK